MKLYSVFDRKANYYLPLFQAHTDGDAMRQFMELVISGETPVSRFPSDYQLMCMGEFDLHNGVISQDDVVFLLGGEQALVEANRDRKRYSDLLKPSPQMDIEDTPAAS